MQDDLADAARHLIDTGVVDSNNVAIAGWSYGGYAALMGLIKEPDLFQCGVAGAAVTDLRELLEEEIDYSNFAVLKERLGAHRKEEFDRVSARRRAGEISAPVLVVHGTADRVVNIKQSREFVRSAKKEGVKVEAIWFEGGGHHLLAAQEDRIAWLQRASAFLKTRCVRSAMPLAASGE